MSSSLRLSPLLSLVLLVACQLQLLSSLPTSGAQCSQWDYSSQRIQSVVPRVALTNPQSLTPLDDAIDFVELPFSFPFYGQLWSSANVSTNGNIQFGSSNELYLDSPFPLEGFAATLAFWQIDLDPDLNTTQLVALLDSTPGQRVWILRLTDDAYCPFAPTDEGDDFHNNTAADDAYLSTLPAVNIDILLYEVGTIEIRYYSLGPAYYDLTIGLQSAPDANSQRQMAVVVDCTPANASSPINPPQTFSNTTLVFTPYCSSYSSVTTSTGGDFAGAVSSTGTAVVPMSATLCFLFYSLLGNVDYPWSSATSLSFTYDPTPRQTVFGAAVKILGGSGTRTFTNRFGVSTSTSVAVTSSAIPNYLYLHSSTPVDAQGISWSLSSAVQLPGHGPSVLYSMLDVYNQSSGVVAEGVSTRVDPLGSAFLSSVSGFQNVTIGAANLNALAPQYSSCQAPITFSNGLRIPTQPSVSNGALRVAYSYSVSDGVSYRAQGNLTIYTAIQFATLQDQLGNPYQQVVNITGTRVYTYLPTGQQLRSTVNGLSTAAYGNADQRLYPYSLLASGPGVYSITTAPFFDYDGIEFAISPSAPLNGYAPGNGTQYNATSLYFETPESTAVLTEGYFTNLPVVQYQMQSYQLLQ